MSDAVKTLRKQIMANPVAARMLVRKATGFITAFDADAPRQAIARALSDEIMMAAILASEEAKNLTLQEYVALSEPDSIEGMEMTVETVLAVAGLK